MCKTTLLSRWSLSFRERMLGGWMSEDGRAKGKTLEPEQEGGDRVRGMGKTSIQSECMRPQC